MLKNCAGCRARARDSFHLISKIAWHRAVALALLLPVMMIIDQVGIPSNMGVCRAKTG